MKGMEKAEFNYGKILFVYLMFTLIISSIVIAMEPAIYPADIGSGDCGIQIFGEEGSNVKLTNDGYSVTCRIDKNNFCFVKTKSGENSYSLEVKHGDKIYTKEITTTDDGTCISKEPSNDYAVVVKLDVPNNELWDFRLGTTNDDKNKCDLVLIEEDAVGINLGIKSGDDQRSFTINSGKIIPAGGKTDGTQSLSAIHEGDCRDGDDSPCGVMDYKFGGGMQDECDEGKESCSLAESSNKYIPKYDIYCGKDSKWYVCDSPSFVIMDTANTNWRICTNNQWQTKTMSDTLKFDATFINSNLLGDKKWSLEKIRIGSEGDTSICNGKECTPKFPDGFKSYESESYYKGNQDFFSSWSCDCKDDGRNTYSIKQSNSPDSDGTTLLTISSSDKYTLSKATAWVYPKQTNIPLKISLSQHSGMSIWITKDGEGDASRVASIGDTGSKAITSQQNEIALESIALYKVEVYYYNVNSNAKLTINTDKSISEYFTIINKVMPNHEMIDSIPGDTATTSNSDGDCNSNNCGTITNQDICIKAKAQSDNYETKHSTQAISGDIDTLKVNTNCNTNNNKLYYTTYTNWLECTSSSKWIHIRARGDNAYSCLDGTIQKLDPKKLYGDDGKEYTVDDASNANVKKFIFSQGNLYACGDSVGYYNNLHDSAGVINTMCQRAGESGFYCHPDGTDGKFTTSAVPAGCGQTPTIKQSPDGSSSGQCPANTCYTGIADDDTKKCVPAGTYFDYSADKKATINLAGDDYCEAVDQSTVWTSRTKQVATKLIEGIGSSSYTLYCDNDVDALPSGETAEIEKACILKKTDGKIAVGGILNLNNKDQIIQFFENTLKNRCPYVQNWPADKTGSQQCENGKNKFWYNKETNTFIFSKDLDISLQPNPITNFINWFKLFIGLSAPRQDILELIQQENFDRLYIYSANGKSIIGYIGKDLTNPTDTQYFITVRYSKFTIPQTICDSIIPQYAGNCDKNGDITTITIPIEDIDNKDDYYPIWQSLTSKLRPK